MWIYKLTNKINGKIYIGQTTQTLTKRFWAYKAEVNKYLNGDKSVNRPIIAALAKYGIYNFSCDILCRCSSKEELSSMEIFLIGFLKSRTKSIGYNIAMGGEGVSYWTGKKRSEKDKKKMSLTKKGKPIKPEVLARRIGKNTGEQNNSAKMTWDLVRQLRAEYVPRKVSTRFLAKKYNISHAMAFNIISNKYWKE